MRDQPDAAFASNSSSLNAGYPDRRVSRTAWASGDTSVSVRHESIHNLTSASSEELAAAVAFGDLGALILGDHTLHLNEQRGLRIVANRRSVEVVDLDAMPGQ